MVDITIRKINETWMRVTCSETYMELDIQDRFSFKVANAQFDPRVKRGVWDGIKKLYNRRDKKMYVGLLYQLLELCDQKSWSVDVDPALSPNEDVLDSNDVLHIIDSVIQPHDNGQSLNLYDYQVEAVQYMMNMDRSVVLSATSSGKSLILYTAVRMYQLMEEMHGKTIFITVPSVSLVEQLYSDFENYSTFEGSYWHVNRYCQKISKKYSKQITKQIVITTWQSMAKLPHDVFDSIGAIFIDETHSASADVLGKLIETATNTPIRHGLTGTLNGCECDELVIQGLLGPSKRIVTAKDIIDKGRASDIEVKMTVLKHQQEDRKMLHQMRKNLRGSARYQAEVEYLNQHEDRRQFIQGMVDSLEGNTLVLFDRVEGYGKEMYEEYLSAHPESSFLIIGDVDSDERERIRQRMEDAEDSVIWASYGTMSTGVSIKKLHNLVLISSSKSKIRVLQSIGRLMRLHKDKDKAIIYDVVDDMTYDGDPNYTLSHAATRLSFYQNEQFEVDFININL